MPFTERFSGVVALADDQTNDYQTWSSQKIASAITAGGGGGGGVVINDVAVSTTTVYSSTKTQTLINEIQQFNYTGAYGGGTAYAENDVATFGGSTWIRVNDNGGNVGDVPGAGSPYWDLLASAGADGANGVDGANGADGATGPQGDPGLSSSLFEYRLDRNVYVVAGLTNGDIRFNNADLTLVTNIFISHLDHFNNDVETFTALAPIGSRILIQQKNLSSVYAQYTITGTPTHVVDSYVAYPVVFSTSSSISNLTHHTQVFLSIEFIITPTVNVGTVSTGAPGTNAIVVNSGTSSAVILDFTIPRGDTGSGGGGGSGFAFNPMSNWTTSFTTGTKAYWYVAVMPFATTISGFMLYTPAGSDFFRVGVYRGAHRLSGSGNITLLGQSTSAGVGSTAQPGGLPAIPFTRRAITASPGQSLTFAAGELMTFAFHSNGSTLVVYGSPVITTSIQELAYTSTSNYNASGFPATLNSSVISSALTNKICIEFY